MKSKIGIILLNWYNWPDTLNCLKDIRKFTYPQELLKVIVVDNHSTDESLHQLGEQIDIDLISLPQNIGFAGANNKGIQLALEQGCEFILLLNNDTSSPPNLLHPLIAVLSEQANAGVVAPKIYYHDPPNTFWYAGGRFSNPRILGSLVGMDELDKGQYDSLREVDFATGCCMFIHRKVFAQIGLLDANLFFYHEDVDFCYRAKQAGFSVWYQPAVNLIHDVSKSTADNLPHRTYLYAKARIIFLCKHIRGLKIPWVMSLEFIRTIRHVFAGIWQNNIQLSISYVSGILAGIQSAYQIHKNLTKD